MSQSNRSERPAPVQEHDLVPSGRGFIALLEAFRAAGGTAPGEVVGRLLDEHRPGPAVSLAKLIFTGQVFGFEWRGSLWIPMFQFDAVDLTLKASVQQVRAALPPQASGWALASWFAQPHSRLGGLRPVDRLEADLPAVLRAARASTPGADAAASRTLEPVHEAREVAAHA